MEELLKDTYVIEQNGDGIVSGIVGDDGSHWTPRQARDLLDAYALKMLEDDHDREMRILGIGDQ